MITKKLDRLSQNHKGETMVRQIRDLKEKVDALEQRIVALEKSKQKSQLGEASSPDITPARFSNDTPANYRT